MSQTAASSIIFFESQTFDPVWKCWLYNLGWWKVTQGGRTNLDLNNFKIEMKKEKNYMERRKETSCEDLLPTRNNKVMKAHWLWSLEANGSFFDSGFVECEEHILHFAKVIHDQNQPSHCWKELWETTGQYCIKGQETTAKCIKTLIRHSE